MNEQLPFCIATFSIMFAYRPSNCTVSCAGPRILDAVVDNPDPHATSDWDDFGKDRL